LPIVTVTKSWFETVVKIVGGWGIRNAYIILVREIWEGVHLEQRYGYASLISRYLRFFKDKFNS
jgi:hypothetical protein